VSRKEELLSQGQADRCWRWNVLEVEEQLIFKNAIADGRAE
jgi:hypothetical protein